MENSIKIKRRESLSIKDSCEKCLNAMNEAFTMAERGGYVGEETYEQILNHMVDSKRFTFEDRYATLTERQKSVLLAIAAEYPTTPTLTSKDFIVKHNSRTSSHTRNFTHFYPLIIRIFIMVIIVGS